MATKHAEAVSTFQPGTHVVISGGDKPPKPPSYLLFSMAACLLCNVFFGCVAVVFSWLSERDYGEGNYESARSKGRIACLLSIVGMVVSVIVVTIIVILYFVVWDRYYHYLPNRYYGDCTEC